MNTIGRGISVKGELHTADDLTVEGAIEGRVVGEDCAVVFGPASDVSADVLARDVTVLGRFSGQIVATDVVDVRAEATVSGQVVSRRFILEEAATFNGRVEPQHLEAALRVAEFQQRKRDAR